MSRKQITILGATGILGRPVTKCLADRGYVVRVLVRDANKTRELFGDSVDIIEGDVLNGRDIKKALAGSEAVHINLTQDSEFTAMRQVIALASGSDIERITYTSATTAREENRWFDLIDVKMRTEAILQQSGIPFTVFCPTWVMETLHRFVHGNRVTVILGRNPPRLHFFAARDFGRIVASSYEDEKALGKRLFIHGPEGITLADALRRYARVCHPEAKLLRLKLWQAGWIARLTRRKGLTFVTKLLAYFDKVGELGDPAETNALYGAPSTTLEQWLNLARDK